MKTKKAEKVITTLKDRIGHPLKRHLTEISTRVNNLKSALLLPLKQLQMNPTPSKRTLLSYYYCFTPKQCPKHACNSVSNNLDIEEQFLLDMVSISSSD